MGPDFRVGHRAASRAVIAPVDSLGPPPDGAATFDRKSGARSSLTARWRAVTRGMASCELRALQVADVKSAPINGYADPGGRHEVRLAGRSEK